MTATSRTTSGKQRFDYAAVDVCEPEIPALVTICQTRMIDPERVQNSSLHVVHVDRIALHVIAILIRLAVLDTTLESPTGKPHAIRRSKLIPAMAIRLGYVSLDKRRAAEFRRPDNDRVFQESPLLEVFHKPGGRLVG